MKNCIIDKNTGSRIHICHEGNYTVIDDDISVEVDGKILKYEQHCVYYIIYKIYNEWYEYLDFLERCNPENIYCYDDQEKPALMTWHYLYLLLESGCADSNKTKFKFSPEFIFVKGIEKKDKYIDLDVVQKMLRTIIEMHEEYKPIRESLFHFFLNDDMPDPKYNDIFCAAYNHFTDCYFVLDTLYDELTDMIDLNE